MSVSIQLTSTRSVINHENIQEAKAIISILLNRLEAQGKAKNKMEIQLHERVYDLLNS